MLEHSSHPQFSGVHGGWVKGNFIITEAFIRVVIEECSVDWFVLDQVKVSVLLVKGVE